MRVVVNAVAASQGPAANPVAEQPEPESTQAV
jgi:hypothetical protein